MHELRATPPVSLPELLKGLTELIGIDAALSADAFVPGPHGMPGCRGRAADQVLLYALVAAPGDSVVLDWTIAPATQPGYAVLDDTYTRQVVTFEVSLEPEGFEVHFSI